MNDSTKCLAVTKIVPLPDQNPKAVLNAIGTKVVLSDGSELSNVTAVRIEADTDTKCWVAKIELTVYLSQVGQLEAPIRD